MSTDRVFFLAMMTLTLIVIAVVLSGCASPNQFPSTAMVEANVPQALTNCPNLPKSPGASATNRQTAAYIAQLYQVANVCKGNNKQVAALLKKYKAQIAKFKPKVQAALRKPKKTQVAKTKQRTKVVRKPSGQNFTQLAMNEQR